MILLSAAPINVSRACQDFPLLSAAETKLIESKGKARSLSLDLYDQWETMNKDGKWRFTSPTHVVLAFAQALKEMEEEGGIPARAKRYRENNRLLIQKMEAMGIHPYIGDEHQGPIITTFFYPEHHTVFFPGNVPVHQRQRLCHLSGKSDRCRYLPHRKYRGDLRRRY